MPVNQLISLRRPISVGCALLLNLSLGSAVLPAPIGLTRDPSSLNDIKDSDISHAKASALFKRPPVPEGGSESKNGSDLQNSSQPQANPESKENSESKNSADLQNNSSLKANPESKNNPEPKGSTESKDHIDPSSALLDAPLEQHVTPSPQASSKVEFGGVSQVGRNSNADPDAWSRFYGAGLKDLREKRFDVAEERFNAALKAARLGMGDDRKLLLTRLSLAQVFLEQKKFGEAEKLFTSCLSIAKRLKADSEIASCKQGLAEVALYFGKPQQAEALIQEALVLREKIFGPCAQTGGCLVIKGIALSKNNWVNEAEDTVLSGIAMIENAKDRNNADLAEALRQAALLFHEHGRTQEAQDLFDKSYRLLEEQAKLNLPPELVGQLSFRWEQGSPRALEIPDAEFPLKYQQLKNVRVAATIVDLWELYGVLISITNVGSERISIGLGKPTLYNTASSGRPVLEKLQLIDPASIDRIRRERNMWDLTQNRPWLANMQKTRSQRGFVPPKGHDLFRGPNVFGVYGEWNALPRDLPDKLMLQPSPERVLYQAQTAIDPGLVRSSTIKVRNLCAVTLEPFESRTGELFFLNPRCEKLLLSVPVGNVAYQIPFSAKRKRIK
jgi:tetratricopeptide (TPR) repeat protein